MIDLTGQHMLYIGVSDALSAALHDTCTTAGGSFTQAVNLDLTTPETAFASLAVLPRFTGIIVRPAWVGYGDFIDLTPNDWDAALHINFECLVYALNAGAKHLIAAGRGGRLLALLSVTGVTPFSGAAALGTTHAMLYAMTRMAAVDLARHGVTINALGMGWYEAADFADLPAAVQAHIRAGVPRGQLTTPHEIAAAAAFLLSPLASGITGAWLAADSGYSITRSAGRSMFDP